MEIATTTQRKALLNNIKLPMPVQFILNKLNDNGYEGFIVGGCVRDCLLGIKPHDWDICTSALPEQVMELFKDFKVIPTGIKHGTVSVVFDDGKKVIYDVKDDMTLPGYSALRDVYGLFQQVQLDESRTCVFWNEDIDLPSHAIYEYGRVV